MEPESEQPEEGEPLASAVLFRAAYERRWGVFCPLADAGPWELAACAGDVREASAGRPMLPMEKYASALVATQALQSPTRGAIRQPLGVALCSAGGSALLAQLLYPPPIDPAAALLLLRAQVSSPLPTPSLRTSPVAMLTPAPAPEPEPRPERWHLGNFCGRTLQIGAQWLTNGVVAPSTPAIEDRKLEARYEPRTERGGYTVREHALVCASAPLFTVPSEAAAGQLGRAQHPTAGALPAAAVEDYDSPAVAYFEVTIVSAPEGGFIGIGVVPGNAYPAHRQPGWEAGSYGWHGDDGKLYEQQPSEEKAKQKADTFGMAGDTVGCGVVCGRHGTRQLFWTKNGRLQPLRVRLLPAQVPTQPLTAAVGLGGAGAHVAFNFGASAFAFDWIRDLPRTPDAPGDLCMLCLPPGDQLAGEGLSSRSGRADAAARHRCVGPLAPGEVAVVAAVESSTGACLVRSWWYDAAALMCCPVPPAAACSTPPYAESAKADAPETVPGSEFVTSAEGSPSSSIRVSRHATAPTLFLSTFPIAATTTVATGMAVGSEADAYEYEWLLEVDPAALHPSRFVLGLLLTTAEADAAPGSDPGGAFHSGLAVRAAGLLGYEPLTDIGAFPAPDLLTAADRAGPPPQLRVRVRAAGAAADGAFVVSLVRHRDGTGERQMLEGRFDAAGVSWRLGVLAYPGCELRLCPLAGSANTGDRVHSQRRWRHTLECGVASRHLVLAPQLLLSHMGEAVEVTSASDGAHTTDDDDDDDGETHVTAWLARQRHQVEPRLTVSRASGDRAESPTVVCGASACVTYLAKLHSVYHTTAGAHPPPPHSANDEDSRLEAATAIDAALRGVDDCWERLCLLVEGATARSSSEGGAHAMENVLARLRRDASRYSASSASASSAASPALASAATATGRLGQLESLFLRHRAQLSSCMDGHSWCGRGRGGDGGGSGGDDDDDAAAQGRQGCFSVVDFAVAPLLSLHLRLCPVPTAAAYPILVAHYTQFCQAASPSVLALLGRAASAADPACSMGGRLAPLQRFVQAQQLQLVLEREEAQHAILERAQPPVEGPAAALPTTAVEACEACPLASPSTVALLLSGGSAAGYAGTTGASQAEQKATRYEDLLCNLFGAQISAGLSPPQGSSSSGGRSGMGHTLAAACLRLSRLYGLQPQRLHRGRRSSVLAFHRACEEEGVLYARANCAAMARHWHLLAFDAAVITREDGVSRVGTDHHHHHQQQQPPLPVLDHEELCRVSLLHARRADLIDAMRLGNGNNGDSGSGGAHTRPSGAAAAFMRPFGAIRHRLALYQGSFFADVDAWVGAFPAAADVVVGVITGILEAVVRRSSLLAAERAHTDALRASQALVHSSSGGLRRLAPSQPAGAAAGADTEDGDGASCGDDGEAGVGEASLQRSTSIYLRDNVGAARPRHLLAPPSARPRRGLAALLNIAVLAGPQPLLVAPNVLKGAPTEPTPRASSSARASPAAAACSRSSSSSAPAKNGGACCAQLQVVQQTNADACGFHAFFNAVTLGRALTAAEPTDALAWLSDLQSTRAFEADMAATQASLRAESRRRAQRGAGAGWDNNVRSVMERSFVSWLLQSDDRVASLGGEHSFSVVEFAEGELQSFDLSETVEFHVEVLQRFAAAAATATSTAPGPSCSGTGGTGQPAEHGGEEGQHGLLRLILLGSTEGKESGHWAVLAAIQPPATTADPPPPPEFLVLDSQNKIGTETERGAIDLLVRCLRGECSLLDGVLTTRLEPLVAALHAEVGSPDPSLARLRATKPAAAWRQDELLSLQTLLTAGAVAAEAQAQRLRLGIQRLLGGIDWQYVSQAPASESAAVADMARVLVAAGSAIGGMDAALLRLPREAEPKPAPEIVAALTAMGFGVYGARRAAMAVANRSVEVAVSWCFEHSGDSDFDTPID